MSAPTPTTPKPVARRKIVMGAAWSIPVIMAAAAVPAQASSSLPPKKSKSSLVFNNYTANNSIAGAQGGIAGNVGVQYPWIANGEIVTANVQVYVNGVCVLDSTFVLASSESKNNITFTNTKPLEVGKTYQVNFILTGKDASGGDVETVSKTRSVKITF